jgi:LacI family transcriptional regulator
MGRVTVHDLAAEAGVSLATVDRVLNRRPGVRQATIERVEAAMARLDYRRDLAAANLAKKRRYPICVILPDGDNPFMHALEAEAMAYQRHAEATRIDTSIVKVPAFDGEHLASALNAISPGDVIGVIAVATDAPRVRVAIDDLAARGVPVVTLVSDIPSSKRVHYAGIDNTAAGRTAGSLLGRFLGKARGKVAIVVGSMQLRDHMERRFGFEQVMAASHPNLELLPLIEGRDDGLLVAERLRPLIAATPDLIGIYGLAAGSEGIIVALQESGRAQDIAVVAHELTEPARRALLDGTFDAVINQDAGHEVRSAVRVLKAQADGLPIIPGQERIRIDIFMRDNLP